MTEYLNVFYRLDDSRARDTGGTGLGLAITKEAVLMHNGTIDVANVSDIGSVFTIRLPYKITIGGQNESKKGVIAIVAVAVLTVAAVVGILIKKDYGSYRYNSELYFFNETATSIVMENREIKYKDDKELAESVIEALMKGPENSRYMKIIEKIRSCCRLTTLIPVILL